MGVTVSYNGADIATLTESGVATLATDNKFCVDDITIEYDAPTPFSLYQEVEYLSIGNSRTYIELPCNAVSGDIYELSVMANDWTERTYFNVMGLKREYKNTDGYRINCGVRADSNGDRRCDIFANGGSVSLYNDSSISSSGGNPAYFGEIVSNGDKCEWKMVLGTSAQPRFIIYGAYSDSEYVSNGRLYKFIVYNSSNTKKVELIPCYRKSDNVCGFYENISGNFYTAVEGGFTAGPDAVSADSLLSILLGED